MQNVSGNRPLRVLVIKIQNFFWTVGGSQRALNNPTQTWRENAASTVKTPRDLNPGPLVTTAPSLTMKGKKGVLNSSG